MVQRKVATVALIFVVSSFLMFAVGMVLVSQADGCEPTAELTSDQQDSRIDPTPTPIAITPTAVITNTLPLLHTTVSPSVVDSSANEVEETQIIATILAATPIPTQPPVPTNQGNNEGTEDL
ncbi:MAG: hypothetical protein LBJ98_03520 [Endomicrobium sp.]|jgi:hypothetical protein|nr:hypothetical protein [Endomicrobium sp.]MDR2645134.1 hypothetical protein [Endomicrobium sp.]